MAAQQRTGVRLPGSMKGLGLVLCTAHDDCGSSSQSSGQGVWGACQHSRLDAARQSVAAGG